MVLVGVGFLTSAIFLLIGSKSPRAEVEVGKELKGLSVGDSIAVGFAQALAILPGVSRSGSTISVARRRGVQGTAAASFSFLLMIPAVAGAVLLDAKEMLSSGINFDITPVAVSFVAAFLVAIAALKLLLGLLRKGRFSCFSYYLIPLGIATVIYGLLA
jgi:undecaprenyl-diphosphatase